MENFTTLSCAPIFLLVHFGLICGLPSLTIKFLFNVNFCANVKSNDTSTIFLYFFRHSNLSSEMLFKVPINLSVLLDSFHKCIQNVKPVNSSSPSKSLILSGGRYYSSKIKFMFYRASLNLF